MLSRRAAAVSTLAAALLASAAPASLAATPKPAPRPVLELGRFQADAGGTKVKDDKRNVNGEWIQVRNTTPKAIAVAGYWIRDVHGHRFVFPKGSVIPARATVTVYTGSGSNGGGRFFWRQGFHVWNNSGDTATLLTPKSARLDACTYKKNPTGAVTC